MAGAEPSLEVLSLDDRSIKLLVKGFPVAYVNALRRLSLSDVPTLAVDFAYFYENNTGIHDEIIAHRLGLTPLKSDEALAKYRSPEECRGAPEGDRSCYVEIEIEERLDPTELSGKYVTAESMKISDPDVKPVYPGTVLFYLAPGQAVHLIAFARLGRGREHAKWSPATVASSKYVPVIHYDGSKASKECLECLDAYPEVRKALESGGKGSIELLHFRTTSGLRYCAETACRDALRIEYNPSKLILDVESSGALRPERIIYEATRCLEKRARRLLELVEGEGAQG
ncbi:DNA-directed RNA polymerase subunit D [Stetteria hydrogenophila]